ncbi:hypothetical protein C8R43DRAFT_1110370 [Mycena crocata]|nr:hypothetical protein C8R43DRAFT_1110370 [Mycena crocata]
MALMRRYIEFWKEELQTPLAFLHPGWEAEEEAPFPVSQSVLAIADGPVDVPPSPSFYHHMDEDPIPPNSMEIIDKHRDLCEGCAQPAHKPPVTTKQSRKFPQGGSDLSKEHKAETAWVMCIGCPVAAHWQCLSLDQRDAVKLSKFTCSECRRGGICIGCQQQISPMLDVTFSVSRALLFRCVACKRPSHLSHIPEYPLTRLPDVSFRDFCPDCSTCCYDLDRIIAWRPCPLRSGAELTSDLSYPREFLVKWAQRSYRHLKWVHERWFDISRNTAEKLGKFLQDNPDSTPEAERTIPSAWTTIERVSDLVLWYRPAGENTATWTKQRTLTMTLGECPDSQFLLSMEDWEIQTGRKFSIADVEEVAWLFVKWEGLGDEDATWDCPPSADGPDNQYSAYTSALSQFILEVESKTEALERKSPLAPSKATKNTRGHVDQHAPKQTNLTVKRTPVKRTQYTAPHNTGPTGDFPYIPLSKGQRNRDAV